MKNLRGGHCDWVDTLGLSGPEIRKAMVEVAEEVKTYDFGNCTEGYKRILKGKALRERLLEFALEKDLELNFSK